MSDDEEELIPRCAVPVHQPHPSACPQQTPQRVSWSDDDDIDDLVEVTAGRGDAGGGHRPTRRLGTSSSKAISSAPSPRPASHVDTSRVPQSVVAQRRIAPDAEEIDFEREYLEALHFVPDDRDTPNDEGAHQQWRKRDEQRAALRRPR